MKVCFAERGWEDYLHWLKTDRKMHGKINDLIKAIQREPYAGIGKPEPLRFGLAGYWSRRIDQEHRIVYKVDNDTLFIAQCRHHYG